MLTGIVVAFIGGDARQLEVIQRFVDRDASVLLFGFDHWAAESGSFHKYELATEFLQDVDAVILPVSGTDDTGKVESIFTSRELILSDEIIGALPSKARVFTGIAKKYLKDICAKHKIELIELLERDDVAIYNSIPTAEGALMMAIQNTDFTIHGCESMVLGFGRTGMTMARVLKALGAEVKVGVRRNEHYARALEMGYRPFFTDELSKHVETIDLLYNTIPRMIVTAQVIAHMRPSALIIDLASKPGGTDFRYAEKRGIKALLAPGLPGIVAPKTAGRIIANCLFQLITSDTKDREG